MAETKTYKKGSLIFAEGVWEMYAYEIISGKVGIYAEYGKDSEKLLTELEAGRMFGEMGLVEARTRSATAVALEDTEVTVIDPEQLDTYLKENPDKTMAILQSLSRRLRELSQEYVEAAETVSEYLTDEKKKNPTLLQKLKEIMLKGAQYAAEAEALGYNEDYTAYSTNFMRYL